MKPEKSQSPNTISEMRKARGLALVIAFSAMIIWAYATRYGHTRPFHDAGGNIVAGSIAEMRQIPLGGVDQSIIIRGKDKNAPILIWLHGGPGQDETGLWLRYNRILEENFTIIYWTQRGTGRSWSADIPPETMTLSQFVSDLDELVDVLRDRFGQQRVVLAGHSWGTTLGVAYAQAHPDKLSAYVGVSQIVDYVESERRTYEFTLTEAKKRKNVDAIAELQKIGPPPYSRDSLLVQRKWLEKFGGNWREPQSLLRLMWDSYQSPEITLIDGIYMMHGQDFSARNLQGDMTRVDWMRDAPEFQMPIFIMAGRYDRGIDGNWQYEYFKKISAPQKRFIWFEQSGHSPPFEEPEVFNAYMIREVLPVARMRAGQNMPTA